MVDPSEGEDQSQSTSPRFETATAGTEAPCLPDEDGSGAVAAEGGVEDGPESEPPPQQQQQGRPREQSPKLHLDLFNFDLPEAEGSRYVLTSPRSLEACARCGVKPVQLLPRPLADFALEAPGRSMRVAAGLFEVYERERHTKLKRCREERERIVRDERRRILQAASTPAPSVERTAHPGHANAGVPAAGEQKQSGSLPVAVLNGSSIHCRASISTPPKSAGPSKPAKSTPAVPQHVNPRTPRTSSLAFPGPSAATKPAQPPMPRVMPAKCANTFPRSASKSSSTTTARTSTCLSGASAPAATATPADVQRDDRRVVPVVANGCRDSHASRHARSHSLESLQRRREPTCSSTTTTTTTTQTSSESGASSSYSWDCPQDRWAKAASPRARTLATFNSLMGRSLSLGDLSHSPQTTQKVERIVKEVKRRGLKGVPERDRKIAALMLAKYQEEDIMSQTRYVAHLQWDSERRLEELRREREEREKQRAVLQCQQAWHCQVSNRQQRLSRQEREASAARMRQATESEERWRELAEQQERSRQQKAVQAAQEEKQKKALQEQNLRALEEERAAVSEQEQLLLKEKLSMAELKKLEREHQAQEERRGLNRAERRRHIALLREIARREAEERKMVRKTLQEKLNRSSENYEHILEKRGQDLRQKARREERQIQKARQMVEQRERQQKEQLEARARDAEKRAHQAALVAEERAKDKALRAVLSRQEKEKLQRLNRQRVEEEEQQRRLDLLQSIERKLEKSEQIFREKRAVLESARSMARASFHVRDRVREETNMRTFDKMALEAKLKANLDEK